MNKCAILIDGSNFYFKLKDLKLQNLLSFDFSSFAKLLADGDKIISSVYYIGAVKTDGTKKTQKLFDNQRRLLSHLKTNNFTYTLGYLLKSDGVFHEKGVDVNIAVDILVNAYENLVDRIILVSSDTDLLPAINKAQEKGKTVEYVGFTHKPSLAMKAKCTNVKLLNKVDLLKFISK